MPVLLRPAQPEDGPAMMCLIRELAFYEKAPEQVTVSMDHFMESGFGPQPVWWAWVAVAPEADGSELVIGFALYYIRYSTWKGQRMYLEDLIITEQWRGKGIGNKLMQVLQEEARLRGLTGMHWQVLDWNKPAIDFYRKFEVTFDAEWINVGMDL